MAKNNNYIFKYNFIFFFLVIVALTFYVAKPFINAILASAVIAFTFSPVYHYLYKKTNRKNISALIVSVAIILLILVPLVLLIQTAAPEAQYAYIRAKQKILSGDLLAIDCAGKESMLCSLDNKIREFVELPELKFYLQDILGKATSSAIKITTDLILSLPKILIHIFLTFFIVFYLLRDGGTFVQQLKRLIPFKAVHQAHIFDKLKNTTHAVIYGSIVVAIIQGLLGGLGFFAFGVPSSLFWGMVMTVTALIPFVGTALIWAPAALVMIGTGTTINDPVLTWKGVGLFFYGLLIISGIDNILKPKLIGERAKIHPVLVIIGVLGGLAVFGIVGFIIGPLTLALFKAMLDIYEREKAETR